MRRPHIVVIGSSNTDLVVHAGHIPTAGETVLGHSYLMAAGGKGANQAVAAARLGAEVTFVACIGTDTFGDAALAGFRREGICTDFVVRDADARSGIALIVVDERGENAIAVAPGANSRLTPVDVERARIRIAEAEVVLLQLEIPLEAVMRAARIASDMAVPVILNPAPAQPLSRELLRRVAVLTPNQGEAELVAGIGHGETDPPDKVATALRALGVPNVVLTMGAAGALLADGRGVRQVSGFRVAVVDTTAAGDAFNGALAFGLASGWPLEDTVRFAVAAGALTVTRAGAQPSLPSRTAVEDLLARP